MRLIKLDPEYENTRYNCSLCLKTTVKLGQLRLDLGQVPPASSNSQWTARREWEIQNTWVNYKCWGFSQFTFWVVLGCLKVALIIKSWNEQVFMNNIRYVVKCSVLIIIINPITNRNVWPTLAAKYCQRPKNNSKLTTENRKTTK